MSGPCASKGQYLDWPEEVELGKRWTNGVILLLGSVARLLPPTALGGSPERVGHAAQVLGSRLEPRVPGGAAVPTEVHQKV
eukprot:8017157-Pyramimonas_sp.AAC.1